MSNGFAPETLLPCLRTYLAGLEVVRDPNTPNNTLPPLWLDPWRGTPYPGQAEGVGKYGLHPTLVLAAYPETGIPSQPFQGFYRQKAVTIFLRGKTSPPVQAMFEQGLLANLHDKRNFLMDTLQINQSMNYRDLQRVGADENGFIYSCEFLFDLFGPENF